MVTNSVTVLDGCIAFEFTRKFSGFDLETCAQLTNTPLGLTDGQDYFRFKSREV
ncbi:hypothetical protein [Flagellimonas onchidii]|uniref:hypothetical protein n=1 Tax=Flagellimonas onchidii TaxID=2562684 RepID=UPI00145621E2|nr:hypothetical protein [Allomuricauda onchidii]